MGKKLFCYLCIAAFLPFTAGAQTSKVLPWNPWNGTDGKRVYHPEPILFVHGINANDDGWERYKATKISIFWSDGILRQLAPMLWPYWVSPDATQLINADRGRSLYWAVQRNYLATFNYGDPYGQDTHNRQSFDHIQWNAWEDDMLNRYFTNRFLRAGRPGYIQTNQNTVNRITLDMRIHDIRTAYALKSTDTNTWPKIVVTAHSMGGLLSHYYLLKKPDDHGVRRLITLATPHLGSHVANWVTWWNAYPGLRLTDGTVNG